MYDAHTKPLYLSFKYFLVTFLSLAVATKLPVIIYSGHLRKIWHPCRLQGDEMFAQNERNIVKYFCMSLSVHNVFSRFSVW